MLNWLLKIFGRSSSESGKPAAGRGSQPPRPASPVQGSAHRTAPPATRAGSSAGRPQGQAAGAPAAAPQQPAADPIDPAVLSEFEPLPPGEPPLDESRHTALLAALRAQLREGKLVLPSFPPLAAQVLATIERPDFDTNELVRVIQRDAVAAAEVLRLANSALYLGASGVENLRDAVVRLGAQATAQAVSTVSARALFDVESRASHKQFEPLWTSLWHHSTVVAFTSSWLSMTYRKGSMDRAFLGGMLHEIGKNVALRSLSTLASDPTFGALPSGGALHRLLEEVHVEYGAALAESWKLPPAVLAVIRDHHAEQPDPQNPDLHIVRLVSGIDELRTNPHHRPELAEVVRGSAAALGLNRPQLQALVTQQKELAKKTRQLM